MFACLPCLIDGRITLLNLLIVAHTATLDGYHMWSCPTCGAHGERLDKR